jgi:hypothetical protein
MRGYLVYGLRLKFDGCLRLALLGSKARVTYFNLHLLFNHLFIGWGAEFIGDSVVWHHGISFCIGILLVDLFQTRHQVLDYSAEYGISLTLLQAEGEQYRTVDKLIRSSCSGDY